MNYLINSFEFIRAYIDELLVLTKGYWKYHINKLELLISKPKDKGLKFNIEKYFFIKTKMEYLSLWVTRYGLKPIDNKTQVMKNMKPPNPPK